jgi:DNA-binding beta-propeller fold protein YncE
LTFRRRRCDGRPASSAKEEISMRALRFVPVLFLILLALAPAAAAQRAPRVKVVASRLDSPRHLAFGPRGDLFVAESGRGGAAPCFVAEEGPACMGASGAVTRIDRRGRQSRFLEGLASYAILPDFHNGIGPHGITVDRSGTVYVTNGGPTALHAQGGALLTRADLAAQNPVADRFGRLLATRGGGRVRSLADIYAFERDVNPDRQVGNPVIDSNPVDVLLDRGRFVVADAGGNAIDVANRRGRVSALTIFPNRMVANPMGGPPIPMQAVPTSVVRGPDGFYYVSQLTGFPFPPRGANIYRVNPRTGSARVFARGFTNLMDLAFDPDGTLYALSIDADGLLNPGTDGALWSIRRGRTRRIALPAGTLTMPGGIDVRRHRRVLVTNRGGSAGQGQVLRIDLR